MTQHSTHTALCATCSAYGAETPATTTVEDVDGDHRIAGTSGPSCEECRAEAMHYPLEEAFDASCYLLAVPNRMPPAIWYPHSYDRGERDDLAYWCEIRTAEDVQRIRDYTGHQAFRVQGLADRACEVLS